MYRSTALKSVGLLILSALFALPLHAAEKKKKGPGKPHAAGSRIDFVAEVGSDMNDAVLAPLEKKSRDIRPSLVKLRDDVLDEAKFKAAASPATYDAAVRLVNAWMSALQERETRRASLGLAAPPTSDLQHGKKTTLHYPDDILTFRREMKDAREFRATEKKKKQFFKDADKNSWRLRTEALRPDLERLYSQFRELRRQS
jgi:hypothetical protein